MKSTCSGPSFARPWVLTPQRRVRIRSNSARSPSKSSQASPGVTETIGRDAALEAVLASRAGILRYSEAGVPHFIFFFRAGEVFRFLNVNDGLEDFVSSAEMFFATHVPQRQYTSVFTVE